MAVTNVAVPAGSVKIFKAAIQLLKDWGWGPYLDLRSGWEKRSNGHRQPQVQQAIMIHHTGGTATSTDYLLNPGDRADLKLLANIHVDQNDRRIRVLAAGPSSHAGNGPKANYDRTVQNRAPYGGDMKPSRPDGSWSANRYTVGVEVDGVGGAKEWTDWTHRAVLAVAAAFNLAGGWAKNGAVPRVLAHKEFTTRKPGDPYMNMGMFRQLVSSALAIAAGTVPPTGDLPEASYPLGKRVLSKDGTDSGPDVAELIKLLNGLGYVLKADGLFGPAVEAAVKDYQGKNGLTVDGKVGPLTAAALTGDKLPEPQPEPELPAPPTVPTPEEPVVTAPAPVEPPAASRREFRMLQANTLNDERFPNRQGVPNNSAKVPAWLAAQRPSIMLLQETAEARRDKIKANKYFKGWKSWATGMVAVFWSTKSWTHLRTASYDQGNGIHGLAVATLKDNTTGLEADFISVHLPPSVAFPASWSDERKAQGKREVLAKALKKVLRDGVATWVGGDFNTGTHASTMKEFGFTRATPAEATVDGSDNKLDAVWFRAGKAVVTEVRGRSLLDPGGLSDHKGWLVNGSIIQKISTL